MGQVTGVGVPTRDKLESARPLMLSSGDQWYRWRGVSRVWGGRSVGLVETAKLGKGRSVDYITV